MTFYETDKMKAARILFDAIGDLEATVIDSSNLEQSSLCIGLDLGKVLAARHFLAATLNMPVVAEMAEVVEPAEVKRALEIVS